MPLQRTRIWKDSNDPDRTFASDEFGPLNIRPDPESGRAPAGKPQHQAANYHKLHGVRQLHGCCSIGDDTMFGVVRRCQSTRSALAVLCSIRDAHPDDIWTYAILNDLSAHSGGTIRRRPR